MKNVKRCPWGSENPLMIEYHDKEWGVPLYDDQKLFEFLCLESAQAGLSWNTILNKREGYRKAFANFDVKKVARFTPKKVEKLLQDPDIVRNRMKIEAAINNAKCFIQIQKEFGSFSDYQWQFVGGKPKVNKHRTMKTMKAKTKEAEAFAKDLKKRGFKFLGPTTVYAHMQACGMVNDHIQSCFRYNKCKPKKK
jgi:DNA-3-methyladenine glycosylase I